MNLFCNIQNSSVGSALSASHFEAKLGALAEFGMKDAALE